MEHKKRVYTFGAGKAEGRADMRNELGGKGANLAEMNLIGVPVPPGFTITTDTCNDYYEIGKQEVVELLRADVEKALHGVEELMASKFGDVENPLLLSVRSGARASMPGMMDTILNLGLNDEVVEGLARKTNNPRFAYDAYRRFVQMYGDVVLGMKPVNKEDVDPFEAIIEMVKKEKGVKLDNELEVEDLKRLVVLFKEAILKGTGKEFPTDPMEQLWGAICAVFDSWMNERAILYRKMEGIPAEWGTAVSVMAMVFGNMGNTSATGVCFSRDAATGEDLFNGEWLVFAHRSRSLWKVAADGLLSRALTKLNVRRNILQWKRLCLKSTSSLMQFRQALKNTTTTCRIWSSLSRKANSGSCRHVTVSELVPLWLKLPWTSCTRA